MNWIDRVELVSLGFGLYELRIGSRVMDTFDNGLDAHLSLQSMYRDFAARNGGAA